MFKKDISCSMAPREITQVSIDALYVSPHTSDGPTSITLATTRSTFDEYTIKLREGRDKQERRDRQRTGGTLG